MEAFPRQQLLGRGSFGHVFKVYNNKNEPQVVKVIKKSSKQKPGDMMREMKAGMKLHHKSIVKVFDTDEDEDNWYIFMEYIEGMTLLQYISTTIQKNGQLNLSASFIKSIFKKLVAALYYSHEQGVAHMDLKLENVMIHKKGVKLIDFGLCCDFNITGYHSRFVGSQDYCAPEILQRKAYRPDKADVWSLGTILYILFVGEMPFGRGVRKQVEKGAVHPKLSWESDEGDKIPKKAKDLMEKMLNVDPNERIALGQVRKHPWIRWIL